MACYPPLLQCFDALPPPTPSYHSTITPSQRKYTLTASIHFTLHLSILKTLYFALSSLSRHIAQKKELHRPEQHQTAPSIKGDHNNTKLSNKLTKCFHTLLQHITRHINTLFTLACRRCRLKRTALLDQTAINDINTTVSTPSK